MLDSHYEQRKVFTELINEEKSNWHGIGLYAKKNNMEFVERFVEDKNYSLNFLNLLSIIEYAI